MNLKKTVFIILIVFMPIVLMVDLIYFPVMNGVLDRSLYSKILFHKKVFSGLHRLLERYTGVGRLYQVDKRLYGTVSYILRKELQREYAKILIDRWIRFLKEKNSRFDPILHISKTRNKVYGMLLYKVRTDKRIPSFLRGKAEQFLNQQFRSVPMKVNLFHLLRFSRRSEQEIIKAKLFFHRFYRFNDLFMVCSLIFVLAILFCCIGYPLRFSAVGFVGVAMSGTILLFIWVFKQQAVALLQNMVSYVGYKGDFATVLVDLAVRNVFSRISSSAVALFLVSIALLIFIFVRERVTSVSSR